MLIRDIIYAPFLKSFIAWDFWAYNLTDTTNFDLRHFRHVFYYFFITIIQPCPFAVIRIATSTFHSTCYSMHYGILGVEFTNSLGRAEMGGTSA